MLKDKQVVTDKLAWVLQLPGSDKDAIYKLESARMENIRFCSRELGIMIYSLGIEV